jgi:YD repeat-containing protein
VGCSGETRLTKTHYGYDDLDRLDTLTLPNDVTSSYSYDEAGRLTLLTHNNLTETLASYDYALDNVGNRTILTETLVSVLDVPPGAYLENNGQVVLEAENGQIIAGLTHAWLTSTAIS